MSEYQQANSSPPARGLKRFLEARKRAEDAYRAAP